MKRIKVVVEVCRRYELIIEEALESAAEAKVRQMSVEEIERIGDKVPTRAMNSSVDVIESKLIKD